MVDGGCCSTSTTVSSDHRRSHHQHTVYQLSTAAHRTLHSHCSTSIPHGVIIYLHPGIIHYSMPSSSTSKKPPSSKHSRTSTHTDRTTISHHGYWNNGDEEEDEGAILFNGKHGGKGKGKGRADALDHVHLLRHMKRTESDDSVIGQSYVPSAPQNVYCS